MSSSNLDLTLLLSSELPLYEQLVSQIREKINNGNLCPGDIVPSESELCDRYNISRSTVRQALGILEKEGYVVRRRGKGTFISEPKICRKLDSIYSFSTEMKERGLKPHSKILTFEIVKAPLAVALKMNLNVEELTLFIVRIRLADNKPMLIESTYIPIHLAHGITKSALENASLYELIYQSTGVSPYSALESYEPVCLQKQQAQYLESSENSCGFGIERLTYDKSNNIIEFTQSVMSGEKSRFEITLLQNEISVNRKYGSCWEEKDEKN